MVDMKRLSFKDLDYYVRRCELLEFTDHENYKAACAELDKRKGVIEA